MTTHSFALIAATVVSSLPLAAQAPAAKAVTSSVKPNWTPPKTPWGDPDLQGEWPATARIPMQRPASMGTRAELTDAELAERQKQFAKQSESDSEVSSSDSNVTINPPSYWQERGKPDRQASLVVDPPDGRIPPLTPEGQAAVKALRGGLGPGSHFPDKVDSWEDFDYYSRCIGRGLVSSMLPTLYNFGNEILQAPGYVIIRNEMIHETRVIPLDGRPHVGKGIATYMGDSRGHFEGNTLVVETTNLKAQPGAGGGLFTEAAVLTERFTRTSPNNLSQ
jgi:hypothetical protein